MIEDHTSSLTLSAFSEEHEAYSQLQDYEFPKVSVVIPTYRSAITLGLTLDRLLSQDYPDLEVIVVDAGSTDATLDMVMGMRDPRFTVCSVSDYQRGIMMNKGISQATGQYLNFLFPGDYYLYIRTLKCMMAAAINADKPELVYCGTLLREGSAEPEVLFRPISLASLKKGNQPTALQSCWFRRDLFNEMGKFDNRYVVRAAFDLMCRFSLHGGFRSTSVKRILVDYDRRDVSRATDWNQFKETFHVLKSNFGWVSAIGWLLAQKDVEQLVRVWWRSLKVMFK